MFSFTKKRLSLHIITMYRNTHLERVLSICKGRFDKIRVCDGGPTSGLKNLCKKYGAHYYYKKWQDDMSMQHNFLLTKAKTGEWILILDDDEFPSNQLLDRLPLLTNNFEHTLYRIPSMMELNGVLQCLVEDMINDIRNGKEQFKKEMFFRYSGKEWFEGASHYGLVNVNEEHKSPRIICEPIIHFKTTEEQIWCDLYQGFIDYKLQGYEQENAEVLMSAFSSAGVTNTLELKKYLEEGNISTELKNLFIEWRNNIDNVTHRWYQWYFLILHPEELPDDFTTDESVIQHIKDMGAYNSYSININGNQYLPIEQLPIPNILRERIGDDKVLYETLDDNVLRVGIIGTGAAGSLHIDTFQYVTGATVVAAMDTNQRRLKDFSTLWRAKSVYTDYLEMIQKSRVDVVSICVPSPFHAEITQDIAHQGLVKGIICEKPMAYSLSEADSMLQVCQEANILLFVNSQRRFGHHHIKAKERIQAGELGAIKELCVTMYEDYFDYGPHPIDLMRVYCGEVESVIGRFASVSEQKCSKGYYVANSVAGQFKFRNGCVGTITTGDKCEFNFVGEKGELIVPLDDWNNMGYEFTDCFNAIVSEINGHSQYPITGLPTGEEGRRTLELLLSVYASVYLSKEIQLPLTIMENPLELYRNEIRCSL